MSQRIEDLLGKLTLDEKVDLVTGRDMWHTRPVAAHSIGSMKVTDGPNGARGDGLMGTGTPTACIPCGSVLGATWDPELLERLGVLAQGLEVHAPRFVHVLAQDVGPPVEDALLEPDARVARHRLVDATSDLPERSGQADEGEPHGNR